MKLNIKEIKYIRQSLEYRAKYYEAQPDHYKQFLNELKPIIKKFIKLEGKNYRDINSFNEKVEKGGAQPPPKTERGEKI